ncbi:Serine-threonine protein kinase [Bifidobacterium animalis subsp. animalis IM386]|nr:Stk1 family PASTA domain-containing Ser/Thr kinase [Bifidobacterium animalis]AFI62314.1 serine-threonine protein kinase [Bifidobacterium animalis subsp. animalis ATCC 25527]ANU43393.1 serine/threonine protein kinase [Bifidobacterium animalis subsp. animalis]AYN22953.1 serine-threonine protein kinase [Bifidobacterium animalis subsp. animalis]KFI41990.1 serine-threonine protein kinase [Bifidobacterium animalis subsp. animalis]MCR1995197.1 Stk1 family PASTA domain-containing Ser/Thr kinase [Bi
MSSMPTTLDNGRYQLGQLVGRGGMAEVHIALDTRLGRTVAVKIMRADLAHDEIFLTRFRREAHSVAQMNNPNIVNIYDSGEEVVTLDNGQTEHLPYLIMEYVQGQTLRDIIKANGALSVSDTEHVMIGVLNALEYSHRMGIIHRDIKPGNIMISEQGIVKVMDFGIARALDDSATTMTKSQGVVGTAQYLSPEQARGENVDMRSDLYSAGCVLYEMLTGRPPFTGDSAVAIAYQHVSEVAAKPSSIVPGLNPMWDQIVAKAMAKDRQNRYATATEFKNDILTYMNGGLPSAAAFNPLQDLSTINATKTQTMAANDYPANEGSTRVYNPVTGQFQTVPQDPNAAAGDTDTMVKSRSQKRLEAARKRKRNTIITVVVLVVLALAAAGGWYAWAHMQPPKKEYVTVPTFSATTTEERAKAQLAELGLQASIKQDTDSREPAGTFTKQAPAGGRSVEKGSTVTVWFSAGPKSVPIPDVTGKSQADARAALEAAGFEVNSSVQTEDSATIERDHVTRTDPAAGTSAEQGSTVSLWVSSGMTKVPSGLIGKSKDEAVDELQKNGFAVEINTENSSQPENTVTRIEPNEGTSVERGASVTIWVSNGKITMPEIALNRSLKDVKADLSAQGFTNIKVDGDSSDDAIVTSMSPAANETVTPNQQVTLTTKAKEPSPSSSSSSNSNGSSGSNGNSGNGDSNSGSQSSQNQQNSDNKH